MTDKKIINIVRANPELEYLMNYYSKYPKSASLRQLLRLVIYLPRVNRWHLFSFLKIVIDFAWRKKKKKGR